VRTGPVELFAQSGVDLAHVVIGHLNDIADQPTVAPLAIAKRGACLGFDHSGKPDDPRLQEYVKTIMAVLDAGHADKVCLSSDFGNQKYLRKNGGPGISMVMTTFVPKLRQAGVDDATLHRILVENPRRVLAFTPRKQALAMQFTAPASETLRRVMRNESPSGSLGGILPAALDSAPNTS
jgi:phosphotriesterase-related protein